MTTMPFGVRSIKSGTGAAGGIEIWAGSTDSPNALFIRWLNHPSYDRYWQKMIPYREQFAHINIPVLTTTGYFAASEPGALYYFLQHYRYNPHANHTLLIGPYDDSVM